ncbi:YdbH domain-containing protein [Methylococcus mesophilus]|uniref:YdbH domain-containing protein n=1 Tax=Methylococcus mesophilus TaxID=2993564 RepID=UPI00224B6BAA|nr:YdbH domain-containing protein [Methylococcus mesophilus]UZR29795.1 YdbH domain-containing protein [Methylococcus mesophilus]
MADFGFARARIIGAYPSWERLRLDELRLIRRYGNDKLSIRAFGVTVNYRPLDLLSGRIDGVHLAKVEVERVPAPGDTTPASTQVDTFPAIAAPGQWLAGLPVEELSVDTLVVRWRYHDAIHDLSATGLLKDGLALVKGKIHPGDGRVLELSARLTENGEMHLAVWFPGKQVFPVFRLDNRLNQYKDGAMKIEGSLQAQVDTLAALLGSWFGWEDIPGKLEGTLDSRWQGELTTSPGVSGGTRIDSEHHLELQAARLGSPLERARVRVDVTGLLTGNRLAWRIGNRSSLSARLSDHGSGTPLDIGVPKGMAGQAEFGTDGLTISLLPGLPVHLSSLQRDGFSLAETGIELTEAATLRVETRFARWSWSPLSLAMPGLALHGPDGEAQAGRVLLKFDQLGGDVDDWEGKGRARIEGIQPVFRGKSLPVASMEIPFRMDGKRIDAEARLVMGKGKLVLSGQARHEVASGHGQVRFELIPVVFGESGDKLSSLLEPWRSPLELRAGRIAADGRLGWRLLAAEGWVLEGEIRLRGEGLAGRYEATAFRELSADLALFERDGLRTSEPARLRVGSLDMGFPVTDLRVTADIAVPPGEAYPVGSLHEFSLGLLGGTAHAEAVQWDFAVPDHPITISLQGLSLGEIVALERRDELQAEGTLDGRLPLKISKAGIAMHGGELHARPPGGVIRYRPTAGGPLMESKHPSTNVLLQALANLNYEVLKVNADSTLDGDLALKVALQGRNPDWQSGRPIHLNLRLEENIPKLLRSLRLADDISKRVQDHFRNKP